MRYAFAALVILALAALPAGAQVPDATPPVVTCGTADGTWHAVDAVIACTASDPESGIPNPSDQAFDLTTSVPAGTETNDAATGTREVCNGGTPTLCSTAGPIPGNMVDKKAPVVVCGTASVAWRSTDASVPCTATDGGSNLANAGQASFFLSTSVPAGTATSNALTNSQSVCDNVSNCAPAGPVGGNKIDKRSPTNPATIRSTDRRAGVWKRDRRISMAFTAGGDVGSGVDGFSFRFTKDAGTIPDMAKDREQTARGVTSGLLGNGRWYFHFATRDNVGNWANPAHRGPYLIDFARPSARALAASGKTGRTLRLRYRTADNNNRTRERITVSRGGSLVASWNRRMAPAQWGTIQAISWRPRTAASYSFCVNAWDPAGNTRRSCAGVRVTNPAPPPSRCHPSYPTVCIPPPPPDLDCGQIRHRNFVVRPPDPHGFDGNQDGVGCET